MQTFSENETEVCALDAQRHCPLEEDPEIRFGIKEDDWQTPEVRAGTIDKLIEYLTHEKYADVEFRNTFLLTYRTLMNPVDLLSRLIDRYPVSQEAQSYEKRIRLRLQIWSTFPHYI